MKKLSISLVIITMMILLVLSNQSIITAKAEDESVTITNLFNTSSSDNVQYTITNIATLYTLQEQPKYRLVFFQPSGFAIYSTELNSLMEYSYLGTYAATQLPTCNKYYAGPGSFYTKNSNGNFVDEISGRILTTQESTSVSNYERQVIATVTTSAAVPASNNNPIFTQKLIANSDYFKYLTQFGDNVNGTGGQIAASMLLGYYDNYYDNNLVADMYRDGNGTNELFHQLMLSYIIPNSIYGSSMNEIKTGMNNYITATVPACSHSSVAVLGNYTEAVDKIDQNFPVILHINKNTLIEALNHTVVGYGYCVVLGFMKYIVHCGFKSDASIFDCVVNYKNYYIDAIWIDGGSSLNVGQFTHNIISTFNTLTHYGECNICHTHFNTCSHSLNMFYNSHTHWEECDCGYKTSEDAHSLRSLGGLRVGCTHCNYTGSGNIELPYSIGEGV